MKAASNTMNFLIMTLGLTLIVNLGFNVYFMVSKDSVPKMKERISKLEKLFETND